MNYKKNLFFFAIIFIISANLSLALPTIIPSSFSTNESLSTLYNITVNNSEVSSTNITMINITLPAGFTFVAGSNGTSAISTNFTNSSTTNVLSWSNSSYLIKSVSNQSFWFNAIANTSLIGNFNISILLVNNTGISYYNISVTVHDVSTPSISIAYPTNTTYNIASTFLSQLNYTSSDNNLAYCWYSTNSGATNSTPVACGTNFSSVSSIEGSNTLILYANDSEGNLNSTSITFFQDTVAPSITLTQNISDTTASNVSIKIVSSDSGSGINYCTVNTNLPSSPTWSSTTYQTSESKRTSSTSLVCGNSFTRTVTCYDNAGNSNAKDISLSTDSCPVTGSSSTGATSTASTTTVWTSTYYQNTKELSDLGEIIQALGKTERLGIKVDGSLHYLGVLTLGSSYANIQVQSTPQNASLDVGQTKKFELTGDNFYDLSVTLDSIKNSKANFTISEIHEAISSTTSTASSSSSSTNATSSNTDSKKTVINPPAVASPSLLSKAISYANARKWIWWSLGVLVFLIIVAVVWVVLARRHKKKHN